METVRAVPAGAAAQAIAWLDRIYRFSGFTLASVR